VKTFDSRHYQIFRPSGFWAVMNITPLNDDKYELRIHCCKYVENGKVYICKSDGTVEDSHGNIVTEEFLAKRPLINYLAMCITGRG
jgi:hypothetical protein